ncbi:hypothetical protein [Mangrovimonas cancribranchiae]|uniref:Uncharacterized protein n=1 Tax=Mangrovimonas cancribranchiae TaxID=3080055 RepID=A0AAU6P781_9FLAO
MAFHSNAHYYYFGTIYNNNNQLQFKDNQGVELWCKQVIKNLKDEETFQFHKMPNTKQALFENFHFKNSLDEKFQLENIENKIIIFIYNHSMGNIFFKDAKEIIAFSKSNPEFDYVILVTDFF